MTWGVCCIETVWDRGTNWSAQPILAMMKERWGANFVHRNAVTRDEFFRHLKSWVDDEDCDYPILYLGYHGKAGEIWLDGESPGPVANRVSLTGVCDGINVPKENSLIHFASCGTLDVPDADLKGFVKRTGASCVSG